MSDDAPPAPASPSEPLTIGPAELSDPGDDRFQRFGLIEWWDQRRLTDARVLVVGAGALGNEIVKNLALLGIGRVLIVDLDRVENSNLSRSILFRAADNGRAKAHVAAEAARSIYPDIRAAGLHADAIHDLGLGVYRWADVVLGGLDNREARLSINRACGAVRRIWIDGAIEQIRGTARVFNPADDLSACYECTLSAIDWKLIQKRRSCNLLSRDQMEQGKTPTTPTIASIIAGVQCQEALKLLHRMPTLEARGWVFDGASADAYTIAFQRNAECYSHEPLDEIIELPWKSDQTTAGDLLKEARRLSGDDEVQLELARDVIERLRCPSCGNEEAIFTSLGRVGINKAACPRCGAAQREVIPFHLIDRHSPFLDRTLRQIGLPAMDILTIRTGEKAIGLELSADAEELLGALR